MAFFVAKRRPRLNELSWSSSEAMVVIESSLPSALALFVTWFTARALYVKQLIRDSSSSSRPFDSTKQTCCMHNAVYIICWYLSALFNGSIHAAWRLVACKLFVVYCRNVCSFCMILAGTVLITDQYCVEKGDCCGNAIKSMSCFYNHIELFRWPVV